MKNDAQSYSEVLSLLDTAKKINPNNINIYRTEIVAYLRHEKFESGREKLAAYREKLLSMLNEKDKMPEERWNRLFNFVSYEYDWVNDMLHKLQSF